MGKYRSRLDILADMLSIISDKARKTQIMYRANLSYASLMKYLDELNKACLARFEQGESCYVLTQKGFEFLDQYRNYLKQTKSAEKRISDVDSRRRALENLCSTSQRSEPAL